MVGMAGRLGGRRAGVGRSLGLLALLLAVFVVACVALAAGAAAADLDFVQFHPTALRLRDGASSRLPLLTEALRGAGATLRYAWGTSLRAPSCGQCRHAGSPSHNGRTWLRKVVIPARHRPT